MGAGVPLLPLAILFGLASLACAALLLVHAFRRSVGTGVMVLLIPFYMLVYAFSQFEHPRKNLIVAGFVACTVLTAVFLGLGAHAFAPTAARLPPPGF
jgi:translocator protein